MKSLYKTAAYAAFIVLTGMLIHATNAFYLEPTFLGFKDAAKDYADMSKIQNAIEACSMDSKLESAWDNFITGFDIAVCQRIQQDQAVGLIPPMGAMQIAISLNRMDVGVTVKNFGRVPRSEPTAVAESLKRIWTLTLYGPTA